MAKISECLPGAVFGKWTVLAQHIKFRERYCRTACECGAVKSLPTTSLGNKPYHSQSCGCGRSEALSKLGYAHRLNLADKGALRSLAAWRNMLSRTSPTTNSKPEKYRGMAPPETWRSFENFYRDMGSCPEGLTLDRIDTRAPYSVDNCKWSTRAEQVKNRECVRYFRKGEVIVVMAELAAILKVAANSVKYRANRGINLDGWEEITYEEVIAAKKAK
jgi:hypothetical protein